MAQHPATPSPERGRFPRSGAESRDGKGEGLDTYSAAWRKARHGDSRARAELIECYRPYVARLVERMGIPRTTVQEHEDLVSAGVIGLIDAVDRFDHSRGVPFEGFARARIRGAILDELRRLDGLGRHFWERVRTGAAAGEQVPAALSLDRLVEKGAEPAGPDSSWSVLEQKDFWNDVGDAVRSLPDRERDVIRRHYADARTLRQIGYELGVSEARVSQLHARAIGHIRHVLTGPSSSAIAFSSAVA